jgi:hypothetical protein
MAVGEELFDHEASALSSEPLSHPSAAVRGQPVPDQGDLAVLQQGVYLAWSSRRSPSAADMSASAFGSRLTNRHRNLASAEHLPVDAWLAGS